MPFDAATLALVEDALSEGFKYHSNLDAFLTRSGVSDKLLGDARSRAEARNAGGRFAKAPKRLVAQEVLAAIRVLGRGGDNIIASIVTGLTKSRMPDASDAAVTAIDSLRAKIETDRREQKQKRET